MTLKHAKGNLIDMAEQGHFDVIVHGCNCMCTMGSGIAKEIRARYPAAYQVDQRTEIGARDKLGSYTMAVVDTKDYYFAIVNAYTQFGYNRKGETKDVFEYGAFLDILIDLTETCGEMRFGLPYIGMGLAGGDKDLIMKLIEIFAERVADKGGSVTLVEFA
jgi:O-acetyl-ADP-ribose deacetylase (regulator of RNase III)